MKQMKMQVDVLFMTVMFVAVTLAVILIFFMFQGGIKPALQSALPASDTTNTILNNGSSALSTFNDGLLIVYFAFGVSVILGAFLVAASPIFFVIGIFLLAIDVLVAVIMHNMFFTIVQQSSLAPYAVSFGLPMLVIEYFPMITFVIALVVLAVTYAPKGEY